MSNTRAITKTGTVYDFHDGFVRITAKDESPYTIKLRHSCVVDRTDPELVGNGVLNWDYIRTLPPTETPEVGKSMYVEGKDDWRLSTSFVSVEVIDE